MTIVIYILNKYISLLKKIKFINVLKFEVDGSNELISMLLYFIAA